MGSHPNLLTARQVESVTFNTAVRGYDPDDMAALLGRIVRTLSGFESGRRAEAETITAEAAEQATLRTSFRGLDLNEVDDFLDDVVATLRHYESGEPGRRPSADRTGESTPQTGTRSRPFERRATLAQAPIARPSPRVDVEADSERSTSISDDEDTEEFRPRSSEELLEQAKKWLDRS